MADSTLKIAVDGRELVGRPTGVGTYLLEILRAWQAAGMKHRVMVVTPSAIPETTARALPGVAWHVEPGPRAGTRWEQTRLPRVLARAKPDVFFAPGNTAPLRLP